MHRRLNPVVLCVAWIVLGAATASARQGACEKVLAPIPHNPAAKVVEVNANTGEFAQGGTSFEPNEKVQLLFVGKNPFKYAYRITQKSEPLDQLPILAFLKLLGLGDMSTPTAAESAANRRPAPARRVAPVPRACADDPQAQEPLGKLQTAEDGLIEMHNRLRDDIQAAIAALAEGRKKHDAFLELTNVESLPADICTSVTEARSAVGSALAIDVAALATRSGGFRTDIGNHEAAIGAFEKAHASCGTAAHALRAEAAALKSGNEASGEQLLELQKAQTETKEGLGTLADLIDAVQQDRHAFADERYLPVGSEAHRVQYTIYRRNLRTRAAPETLAATLEFSMGRSRFALAGGFGFSNIDDVSIVRQSGLVADGSGGTKVGSVFGFENNSRFKPGAVVLLNAALYRIPHAAVTVGGAGGVVIASRGSVASLEYLAGASLAFLNDQFFITPAFHAAKVQSLGGGFRIGDPVPEGLADPLPLENSWQRGFIVTLTWKMK